VSNDAGNVDLVAGENIEITSNDEENSITISAVGNAAGDISAVSAETGLIGGGVEGGLNKPLLLDPFWPKTRVRLLIQWN
jgi:hypothetical protein